MKFYEIYGFKSDDSLRQELIRLYYDNGLSQVQIAKKFGCLTNQICKKFKLYNIKSRSFAEGNEIRIRSDVILTQEQTEIINGMLLGDGGLTPRKYTASLNYSSKHKKIIKDCIEQLPFICCPLYTRNKIGEHGQKLIYYEMNTHGYKQLLNLYNKWYMNGIKIIPRDLKLTPITCYWWYLGDGSSCKNELRLCTQGFSFEDVEFLKSIMPIPCKIRRVKCKFYKKIRPYISILTDYMKPFLNYIGPVHENHKDLDYRWILQYGRSKNGVRYTKKVRIF